MSRYIRRLAVHAIAILTLTFSAQPGALASSVAPDQRTPRAVDLVIALDVSSSMSGLIESAKQRLWDVVNEITRAQPAPDLRVALLTYGNPRYGKQTGFVRVDLPFTRDLDAVNEALFGLSTSGGNEYVARVIARANTSLRWSTDKQGLRMMFVAGNEPATQDPLLSVAEVARAARAKGIVINTIYCGRDSQSVVAAGWRQVAIDTDGFHAAIDHNVAAVANIATPYDQRLNELNSELNKTYLPYGEHGAKRRQNQLEQDANAQSMSAPAAASRAVTKAGRAYRSESWDLVDALESGTALEAIEAEALPEEMRTMDDEARRDYVKKQSKRRAAIRKEINALDADRRGYIARERATRQASDAMGLDSALKAGLLEVAKKRGLRFAPQ